MRARGFTLIEVLIAATILFTVLAFATETYRNSLLASSRAEGLVSLLTPLQQVVQLNSLSCSVNSAYATLLGREHPFKALVAHGEAASTPMRLLDAVLAFLH